MKRSFAGILAASALVASFAISPAANAAGVSVTGGGSSYDNAIIGACATAADGVTVTYTKSSSGTGRSSFTAGSVTFGAMDWPYTANDAKPTKAYTYVPLVAGPIVVAYNVPGLNLKLDAKTLSGILKGTIATWNDAAIAKINKGATLPSQPITIVYRAASSGTTQNLVAYLRDLRPTDGWKDSGTYTTASGNSKGTGVPTNTDIVNTVKKTAYTIGYADLADTLTAGVQAAAIKNGVGKYVKPTVPAAAKFLAKQPMANTGLVKFDYEQAIKGAYNLALVSYAAAPTAAGTDAAAALKTWFNAYLSTCAPSKAAGLGYVALSGSTLKTALKLAAKVG
jgi:phosphate transport system substrate-binding protein